ncbi:hypothetical protein SprV_0802493300 [Sparganum proliferum]
MVPRRGDAVCTSRRCELRHLAAWAERVITSRQIDVPVDRVGVRHPRLQQFSPCLVVGSRQYQRVDEVELMAFLQRVSGDLRQWVASSNGPFVLKYSCAETSSCLACVMARTVLARDLVDYARLFTCVQPILHFHDSATHGGRRMMNDAHA